MRFNAAFGKNNVISLNIKPVTNRQWLNILLDKGREVTQIEYDRANLDPDGPSFTGTLEKARSFCEGGTVVFA